MASFVSLSGGEAEIEDKGPVTAALLNILSPSQGCPRSIPEKLLMTESTETSL